MTHMPGPRMRWPALALLMSLSSLPTTRPQELHVVLRNLSGGPVALYWLDRSAGDARRWWREAMHDYGSEQQNAGFGQHPSVCSRAGCARSATCRS